MLIDLGKIYINLFDESLGVKTYITYSKRIDEKTAKFILKCENIEQAKMIKETEEILDRGINAKHNIELIDDNSSISLLVKFK